MDEIQQAHRRLDTLEQVVSDLEARVGSSGSTSSSSGGTGRTTVSSFFPGLMLGSDFFAFSRLFKNAYTVTGLTIRADTASTQSGGVDFDVRVSGTVKTTITLGQGVNRESYNLTFSVSDNDVLEVLAAQPNAATSLADVNFTFTLD